MYKKILVGGVTAAVIIGAGGTALAVSGSDSSPATPTTTSSAPRASHPGQKNGKHPGNRKGRRALGVALRRVEHGQIVMRKKNGTVTHDFIRGTVGSVSATSITVAAMDKTSETFTVTKDTKVRVRDNGKGTASSIDKVAKGDRVLVAGTGTSAFTAKHVVDVKGMKKQRK